VGPNRSSRLIKRHMAVVVTCHSRRA
jgi:hypothetical protein